SWRRLLFYLNNRIRLTQWFFPAKVNKYWCSNKHRRISTCNDTHQHRKCNTPCYFTTNKEQNENGEKYRKRGHDRTAQRMVNGIVNDLLFCCAGHFSCILTYPVKHDHGIVH